MPTLAHFLQYGALRLFSFLLACLPDVLFYPLARAMGGFVFSVFRLRRRASLEHLKRAFGPALSPAMRTDILAGAYRNIAITFLELLLPLGRQKRIIANSEATELALVRQALAQEKGVVLVGLHFGSWEYTAGIVAAAGLPITVVAARQANPLVDRFINRQRQALGLKVMPLSASARELVSCLKNKGMIGLISDQNAGRHGIFVEFFGEPASTHRGAAQLALKFGTPLIVITALRTSPGRYRFLARQVPIRPGESFEEATRRYTEVLEEIIRSNPEQYFWMHRRWKTRPPVEKEEC